VTSLPRRVEKPWGYELIWAHTDRYVGKVLHIDAGHLLSLQYHEKKDESIFVQRGSIVLRRRDGDEMVEEHLGPGAAFRVPPGMIHQFEALEDCDLLEVSTPEIDDVVRLEDRYGRV
jgi:mannose-6-phosphate isomerase-like protein (cupin superfamily)